MAAVFASSIPDVGAAPVHLVRYHALVPALPLLLAALVVAAAARARPGARAAVTVTLTAALSRAADRERRRAAGSPPRHTRVLAAG
jgi:hypothetical protein